MIIMNTQLQCSAFTAITAFVIFVTPDVITGNIECTKNISIFSINNTNNETVDQIADVITGNIDLTNNISVCAINSTNNETVDQTADVITENIKLTKNITIVSTNSTNNKTVDQTPDSGRRISLIGLIIHVVSLIVIIIVICVIIVMIYGVDNIINNIRNGWRNTMYRLRNWRRHFRRNHPEPPVRYDINRNRNGGIEIIEPQ